MIDRGHDLPITKQAEVLRISRGSIYYLPRPVPEADLAIMPASRPGCTGVPLRRLADVARPAGGRGVQDRPPSREDVDAADGDRGALIAVRARLNPSPATKSTHICCAVWQ